MRLAILADIHGNMDAFRTVLEEAENYGIEKYLLLGDYIGYYYAPDLVIKQLMKLEHLAIRGNHEDMFFQMQNDKVLMNKIRHKYGAGHRIASMKLDETQKKWLKDLPERSELILGGKRILLCHGAPWKNDFYIYPDADNEILSKFESLEYDIIFFGHTHYRFNKDLHGKKVINPGSVGQSREKGGVAFWGILDSISFSYKQMATPYDSRALKAQVKENDPDLIYNYKILDRE